MLCRDEETRPIVNELFLEVNATTVHVFLVTTGPICGTEYKLPGIKYFVANRSDEFVLDLRFIVRKIADASGWVDPVSDVRRP